MIRPTSSYLCSCCKTQLFTNLDIQIHEATVTKDENEGRNKSKAGSKAAKSSKTRTTNYTDREPQQDLEIATIIDFKGTQSAKSQFNSEHLDKHLPITYIDPMTGQKKCEYRCYNIFTCKLANMVETDQCYGFLFCPNSDCGSKVGIFSFDGQKCQTCYTMVAPAFQWFRSRLVQHKYGDGGSALNKTTLSQLNGLTTSDQYVIKLGSKQFKSRERNHRMHGSASNRSLSNERDDFENRSTSRNRIRNVQSANRGGFGIGVGSRKFGELMIV